MEPRVEEKVGRFRILKLEDRVAPCGLGSLINNLTSSLAPCSSVGSPSIAAGLNASVHVGGGNVAAAAQGCANLAGLPVNIGTALQLGVGCH